MTDENRRRNVEAELARAREALAAAEALVAARLAADALSRAYYGAFHLVRALLVSRGVEPKTHQGAIHLFNVEFVRTGVMPASHNRVLALLQRSRELADYDAAVSFTVEDAASQTLEARAFEREVVCQLVADGVLPP